MAAIIGSLVFVGLELRQSHEIAIADQYQRRADASSENWALFLQADRALVEVIELMEAVAQAGQLPASLTHYGNEKGFDVLATRYALHMVSFTNWDSVYFQYQHGFLAEEAWASQRRRLKASLESQLWADMYRARSWIWRQSFQDLCDAILKEIESGK